VNAAISLVEKVGYVLKHANEFRRDLLELKHILEFN